MALNNAHTGVLNILGDLFGVVLMLVAIFTIVGVVRQMCPRVVGVSYHILATCGVGMASGELKIVTLVACL